MIYIFFDTKWKLFDGELPVKPNVNPVQYVDPNYHPEIYDRKHPYLKMEEYNQAIADIKAKASELDHIPSVDGLDSEEHCGTKFYLTKNPVRTINPTGF